MRGAVREIAVVVVDGEHRPVPFGARLRDRDRAQQQALEGLAGHAGGLEIVQDVPHHGTEQLPLGMDAALLRIEAPERRILQISHRPTVREEAGPDQRAVRLREADEVTDELSERAIDRATGNVLVEPHSCATTSKIRPVLLQPLPATKKLIDAPFQ